MTTNISRFILAPFLCMPIIASAAETYVNPIVYGGVTTVPEFLLAVVDLVFLIAVPILVMCIIYSGFLFVTSGDNEAQVKKARFVFMWTTIGGVVLLGAKVIAAAIESTVLSLS
jgi:hypothetical protein